jgi:Ser/Thr protein kinase RdoA (MazF antagonist)
MEESERRFVTESYRWNADANFVVLYCGENNTYVVETETGKYALRRYRPGRFTLNQVRAEVAWMDRISKFVKVPRLIKNRFGDAVSVSDDDQGHMYTVSEFVKGDLIIDPTEHDYHELGRLMHALHISSDQITESETKEWEGWNRPKYNLNYIVDDGLQCLLDFSVLTSDDKKRCVKIAQNLTERWKDEESGEKFIHADLHFGNILSTTSGFCYLDFDECGFGHRSIDIGVARLHLRATANPEKGWKEFERGYGATFVDEEIRLGTALRIFYMIGKIPHRQDIEELRLKSADYIRRYLGYIESEIFSD